MKKDNRVKPSLSKKQWEKIQSMVGNKTIKTYIVMELVKLDKICNDISEISVCEKCQEERKFPLGTSSWEAIKKIQEKTGIKDPTTIVSRFILTPLLIQKSLNQIND